MSVELCKVNLWLESLEPGKPLSFLDAHIQCGDSLVGVGPGLDISVIPDEAFNPAFSDDKKTATSLKKRNKRECGGQFGLFGSMRAESSSEEVRQWLANRTAQVEAMPEDLSEQVQAKAAAFAELLLAEKFNQQELEHDLWTAAFFWPIPKSDAATMLAPTQQALVAFRNGNLLKPVLLDEIHQIARDLNFFHWELAFPQVFPAHHSPLSTSHYGFDCVLGNPPWERIKLQEKEFFATLDSGIANAPTDADRQKLIDNLQQQNSELWFKFIKTKHAAECQTGFAQQSKRFPLTAVGDINTYPLFAELARSLLAQNGRAGLILPTGIATDYSTRFYFQEVVTKKNLVSLFDFDNSEGIFPSVKPNVRFCLFSIINGENREINLAAQLVLPEELNSPIRRYKLAVEDIRLVYPNTLNCPMFRLQVDAQLITSIHRRFPVLLQKGDGVQNPWNMQFSTMFHMSNDSGLFKKREQLEALQYSLVGNIFLKDNDRFIPLYESKLAHQFNHRLATFEGIPVKDRFKIHAGTNDPSESEMQDPHYFIIPRYWINEIDVSAKVNFSRRWFLGFRNAISATADSRSVVASILPWSGIGNSMPLMIIDSDAIRSSLMLGMLNSLVLDYVLKQKVSGANLNFYIVEQLPVLPPSAFTTADIDYIAGRVLELVYTAYDMRPFAEDMGYLGEPFHWDEERRALLRAELDAYYAKLYGLTRDELRYILDPQEVYGPDFPGETFRVLKDKEFRQFGEYRTRRLVLEAWDRLFGSESGSFGTGKSVIHPPLKVKPKPSYSADYTLEPNPSRGGQAEVFIATNRKTGEKVALKRLLYSEDKHAIERMKREITSLLSINHVNVMPIIDFGQDFYWYTMPIAQQSLFEHTVPISETELQEIIEAIANGLKAGHRQGDVHRDVTPRNIFLINKLPNETRWVIGDWGLVRQQGLTGTMQTGAMGGFGTLGFAPPELWDDPHNAKQTVDVYSLGRVIAWALTGKNPAPNISLVPPQSGWNELVREMTEMDPAKRLADMDEVLRRIENLHIESTNSSRLEGGEEGSTAFEAPIQPDSQFPPLPLPESQPTLSDFGLYKCLACNKMVMGYEKDAHVKEVHRGVPVEWKKVR